jgi:hypothetical protein
MSNDKIVLTVLALDEKDAKGRAEREFSQLAGGRHRFDILEIQATKESSLSGWDGRWIVAITYNRWRPT